MVLSRLVGAEVRRKEDPRLITGSSMYVDDLTIPGMAYVAIVRSPHPHAKIGAIDSSVAKMMPGVIAVVTGEELAQYCGPLSGAAGEGGSGEEADYEQREEEAEESPPVWPIARDTVRWVGEAVAAVVAESRYRAEDAAEAVEVDYEVLPSVTDPEQAMEDGAPQLYPGVKNNIGAVWDRDHGDIAAAFADAPVVAKARIRSQRLSGVPMEPRAVAATPDPLINGITVWTSTQAPHWNRNSIADALGLPATRVRAIAPEVGGGFGVKIGAYQEDFIVAALAFRMQRPVKWIETRSENFLATNHGRDQWADVEIAAELTGRMSSGCYDIPALEFRSRSVYTNKMALGAYRGAGRPEAAYYVERAIDLLADAAGLDPRGAASQLHRAVRKRLHNRIRRKVPHGRLCEGAGLRHRGPGVQG